MPFSDEVTGLIGLWRDEPAPPAEAVEAPDEAELANGTKEIALDPPVKDPGPEPEAD